MTEYVHRVTDDEHARIARFVRWFALGTVLFVLTVIVLFVTADSWLKLISIEAERRFIEPYINLALEHELIDGDPELQAYVSALADEINARLDNDWAEGFELRVYVIDSDLINAFATLGGYIFVFDGLIEAVGDENALAMVLGHEIAHIHHRDPLLGTGRGMLIQLAIASLSGNNMDPTSLHMGSEVILTSYSRDQELAADELSLALLHDRYGHVGGAARLFELIDDDTEDIEFVEFLSTHPDPDARIERIQALSAENGWPTRDTVAYPEQVQAVLGD
ncbi:MAG: M48 family metallopeptidase [Pseudomonadota bacterium]